MQQQNEKINSKLFTIVNIDQAIKTANRLAKKGLMDEVKIICQELDKKYPNNIRTKVFWNNISINKEILEPSDKEFNILVDLYQNNKFEKAINNINILLKDFPTSSQIFNLQGAIFSAQGKFLDAIKSYNKAVKINPNFAEAFNNLGVSLVNIGEFDNALKSYKTALSLKPNYSDLLINIGIVFSQKGEYQQAIENFEKSIASNPNSPLAYLNLAITYNLINKKNDAITSIAQSIRLAPDNDEVFYNFGIFLQGYKFDNEIPYLSSLILSLLHKKNFVRPLEIMNLIIQIIKKDIFLLNILDNLKHGKVNQNLEEIIFKINQVPLLIEVLKISPISNLEIENLLIEIRRSILIDIENLSHNKEILKFTAILATQCFLNEFIYYEQQDEKDKIKKLEIKISSEINAGYEPNFLNISILASYRPLSNYNWIDSLSFPKECNDLQIQQVDEIREEKKFKNQIEIYNSIKNNISQKVKAQYEVNPYPRWKNDAKSALSPKSMVQIFKDLNLKFSKKSLPENNQKDILIAGCGTGQQIISVCSRYKNCNVFAIDISLSSLAYAKRKTIEFGYSNVKFMLIDILDLPSLDKKFDLIECCGVLHHMGDPLRGWKVLTECLKPKGFMKIGLYSDLARRDIKYVRQEIMKMDIPLTSDGIKSFRHKIKQSYEKHHKNIFKQGDSFSLSNFRDLLFHVQEYRYTIPEIQNCMDTLNLKFCGFEVGNEKFKNFNNINSKKEDIYNLNKWHIFEEKYPHTFIGMYQFYCQKH